MQQSTLKSVIYFLLALTPLTLWIVSDGKILNILPTGGSGLFFPFISGKNLLFRLFVEGAFILWLILAYQNKEYRIQRTPLSIALFVFTGIVLLADLLGVNKIASLFSGFERMEGFVGHIHYVLYFIVLTSLLKEKADWVKFSKWFFVTNGLIALWGAFQLLGSKNFYFYNLAPGLAHALGRFYPVSQGVRIDSTLGNPAYFSMFLVYMIFLCIYGIITTKNKTYKYILSLAILGNLLLHFYTATRSATLGLLVGIVVSGAVLLFDRKKFIVEWVGLLLLSLLFAYSVFFKQALVLPVFYLLLGLTLVAAARSLVISEQKSKKLISSLFVVVIAVVMIFTYMRKSPLVANNMFLNRFATISVADPTGNSRVMIWKMSIQGFKERPLLGWGQDNFPYVFAKYHDPNMYAQEPWFDRSHNVFFDWLIAAGILGLLGHLSLYLFAVILTLRAKLFSHSEKSLIYGVLIAQFVNNLFIFDNLASYILFFALLAYVSAMYSKNERVKADFSLESVKEWFVPVAILMTIVLSLYSVILPYFANKATIRGLMNYQGDVLTVMQAKREGYESGVSTGYVGNREIKEQLLSATNGVLAFDERQLPPAQASEIMKEKNIWFALASGIAKTDIARYPNDLRVVEVYGNFYMQIGDIQNAEKLLLAAHSLSPKRQRTSFSLIQLYLLKGDLKSAYLLSKKTYELAPAYDVARKAFLSIALRIGEKEFNAAVLEIHKDKQLLVYPTSLSSELVGIKDKKTTDLFVKALEKDYPDKIDSIEKEYKELLSKK